MTSSLLSSYTACSCHHVYLMFGQTEAKALPPTTTSKEAYVEDVDDDTTPRAAIDEKLSRAYDLAANNQAQKWKSMDKAALDQDRTKLLGAGKEDVVEDVSKIFKDLGGTSSKTNKLRISANAESVIDKAYNKAMTEKEKEGGEEANAEAMKKRKAVNRVLRLIKNRATPYELLGVTPRATDQEIKAAYKKLQMDVHPDKNSDKAAAECSQAINQAKEILEDRGNRDKLDAFMKKNHRPQQDDLLFDESFAPNAFGEESDDDDDPESNSDNDDEKEYPEPDEKVRKVHSDIKPQLAEFFKGDATKESRNGAMAYIRILNTSIRKANKKAKRDLDLYQIQEKTLYEFNYLVRRIEVFFEMKLYDVPRVVSEANSVQAMIERESKKNKNQWPADWVDTIMAPLRNGIAEISGDAASQQPNPSVDQSQSSHQPNAASQPNGQLASATNPSVADSTPPPQLQALQPGYTPLGHEILAYMPTTRHFKTSGQTVVTGFKFFVKVSGSNPLQLATGMDVGGPASMAYHALPDDKRNDVRNSAERCKNMNSQEFGGILGIAFTSDAYDCHTYVWAATLNQSISKPLVITKTALRNWVGFRIADKFIDDFCVNNGIVPPWATMEASNSARTRYIQLQYPHISHRQRLEYYAPFAQPGSEQAIRPGYHGLYGYSQPQIPSMPAPPDSNAIEELTKKIEMLEVKMERLLLPASQ